MLDEFPKTLPEEIDRTRGLSYLRGTPFEPLGITSVLSFFKGLVTDQDGAIRKDMRIAERRGRPRGQARRGEGRAGGRRP